MKSQKGITLISLVIYISIFMIVIAVMTTITNYFYKNVTEIKEPLKYVTEINKFSMFFVNDVKNNASTTSVTENSVTFEDGTRYVYNTGKIYRNDVEIAKNIKQLKFSSSIYTVGKVNKNIINVQMILGSGSNQVTRDIDFVLRYW